MKSSNNYIGKYIRLCPICNDLIYHTNRESFIRSIKKQATCKECKYGLSRERLKEGFTKIIKNKTVYIKLCPNCSKEMIYTTKGQLKRSIENKHKCKKCVSKLQKSDLPKDCKIKLIDLY